MQSLIHAWSEEIDSRRLYILDTKSRRETTKTHVIRLKMMFLYINIQLLRLNKIAQWSRKNERVIALSWNAHTSVATGGFIHSRRRYL